MKASAIVGQGRGGSRTGHLDPFFVPVKKRPALAYQDLGGAFAWVDVGQMFHVK